MSERIPWSGLWWIEEPYGGLCVLNQVMYQMFGDYAYRGGTLEGTVRGRTLVGTWKELPSSMYKTEGRFRIVMSTDGETITGHWWYVAQITPPPNADLWVMRRKHPADFLLRCP